MQEVQIKGIEDGKLVVALFGDIHSGNAEGFYQEVVKAYAQNPCDILFDCQKLDFIDSTTLGTFVKILKKTKSDGFKMSLINLQSKIKKLFVICSLDSVMEIA